MQSRREVLGMGFLGRLGWQRPAPGPADAAAAETRPAQAPHIAHESAIAALTGGMGEPYCSQACYDRGGAAITTDLLTGWQGPCSVCGQPLTLAPGSQGSAVCDGPGLMLRFHQKVECVAAVRERMAVRTACVVCDAPTGQHSLVLTGLSAGHRGAVVALLGLPDGRMVSGAADGSIIVWDLSEAAPPLVLSDHGQPVTALARLD